MENTREAKTPAETEIRRNTDPKMGPTDGVECTVQGILTQFIEKRGKGVMRQSQTTCKILASVETGTISISMKNEKGLMMTVRLDEMVGLVAAALNVAREQEASKEQEQEDTADGKD